MENRCRNPTFERLNIKRRCSSARLRNPSDKFMRPELQSIFTIGVYGSTEESFFGALVEHDIELFIDIRARRGMRGAKYKYANSSYLQAKLKELGIYYAHLKELAPTAEIRMLQWQADKKEQTRKRDRKGLSKSYISAYRVQILKSKKRKPENKLSTNDLLNHAKQLANYPANLPLHRVALFCVEQNHKACHRWLVAEKLKRDLGIKGRGSIVHI